MKGKHGRSLIYYIHTYNQIADFSIKILKMQELILYTNNSEDYSHTEHMKCNPD